MKRLFCMFLAVVLLTGCTAAGTDSVPAGFTPQGSPSAPEDTVSPSDSGPEPAPQEPAPAGIVLPDEYATLRLEDYFAYDHYVEGAISINRDTFFTLPDQDGTMTRVYLPRQNDVVFGFGHDPFSLYGYDFDNMRLYLEPSVTAYGSNPVVKTMVTLADLPEFEQRLAAMRQKIAQMRLQGTIVYETPVHAMAALLEKQGRTDATFHTTAGGRPYFIWQDPATEEPLYYFADTSLTESSVSAVDALQYIIYISNDSHSMNGTLALPSEESYYFTLTVTIDGRGLHVLSFHIGENSGYAEGDDISLEDFQALPTHGVVQRRGENVLVCDTTQKGVSAVLRQGLVTALDKQLLDGRTADGVEIPATFWHYSWQFYTKPDEPQRLLETDYTAPAQLFCFYSDPFLLLSPQNTDLAFHTRELLAWQDETDPSVLYATRHDYTTLPGTYDWPVTRFDGLGHWMEWALALDDFAQTIPEITDAEATATITLTLGRAGQDVIFSGDVHPDTVGWDEFAAPLAALSRTGAFTALTGQPTEADALAQWMEEQQLPLSGGYRITDCGEPPVYDFARITCPPDAGLPFTDILLWCSGGDAFARVVTGDGNTSCLQLENGGIWFAAQTVMLYYPFYPITLPAQD